MLVGFVSPLNTMDSANPDGSASASTSAVVVELEQLAEDAPPSANNPGGHTRPGRVLGHDGNVRAGREHAKSENRADDGGDPYAVAETETPRSRSRHVPPPRPLTADAPGDCCSADARRATPPREVTTALNSHYAGRSAVCGHRPANWCVNASTSRRNARETRYSAVTEANGYPRQARTGRRALAGRFLALPSPACRAPGCDVARHGRRRGQCRGDQICSQPDGDVPRCSCFAALRLIHTTVHPAASPRARPSMLSTTSAPWQARPSGVAAS